MTHQEFQYRYNIPISYLVGTWRETYCFLLYLDLCNILCVIFDTIRYIIDFTHKFVVTYKAEKVMHCLKMFIPKESIDIPFSTTSRQKPLSCSKVSFTLEWVVYWYLC